MVLFPKTITEALIDEGRTLTLTGYLKAMS